MPAGMQSSRTTLGSVGLIIVLYAMCFNDRSGWRVMATTVKLMSYKYALLLLLRDLYGKMRSSSLQ